MCYYLNIMVIKNCRVLNALKICSLQVYHTQLRSLFKSSFPHRAYTILLTLNFNCVRDNYSLTIRSALNNCILFVQNVGDTILLCGGAILKPSRYCVCRCGKNCENQSKDCEDARKMLHGVSLLSGSVWQLEYYSL